jgi:hypothetical protein
MVRLSEEGPASTRCSERTSVLSYAYISYLVNSITVMDENGLRYIFLLK